MGIIERIFGKRSAPRQEPAKPKEHPLIVAARERANVKKKAYGIVYRADGSPAIEQDWVVNLPPFIRTHVDNELLGKGYKIIDNPFSVVKV